LEAEEGLDSLNIVFAAVFFFVVAIISEIESVVSNSLTQSIKE
jgi:hypothetical protein